MSAFRIRFTLRTVIVAALICFAFAMPRTALAIVVGDQAVLTEFTNFDGTKVSPADLKGRPVLLYFWASWCPTCYKEMPMMQKTYNKYKDKGFVILAINIREERANAEKFYKRHGFDFPSGSINAAYLANYPGIRATPTWFLIDRAGVISAKSIGTDDIEWELEKRLLPLL